MITTERMRRLGVLTRACPPLNYKRSTPLTLHIAHIDRYSIDLGDASASRETSLALAVSVLG